MYVQPMMPPRAPLTVVKLSDHFGQYVLTLKCTCGHTRTAQPKTLAGISDGISQCVGRLANQGKEAAMIQLPKDHQVLFALHGLEQAIRDLRILANLIRYSGIIFSEKRLEFADGLLELDCHDNRYMRHLDC